jgi:beta-glucuronidase
MEIKANNYQEQLHNQDCYSKYSSPLIGHESIIFDRFRKKEFLNGNWNFEIDQYDTFLRAEWYKENSKDENGLNFPLDYSFDHWQEIYVPSCWNTADRDYFYYEGTAIYTRTFKYINKGESRVLIKFGAINYEARVFLNKEFIGYHKGGSTPFFIEVTDNLLEENRIHIVANNKRSKEKVPMDNTDWFNYGGVYRDVEIIRLEETFIKDFHIALLNDSNYKKISVQLQIDGDVLDGKAILKIPELNILKEIEIIEGKGALEIEAEPELWCPENPKLYDVEVEYCKDFIKDRVGFREIKVVGTDIYLNGKNIFLKGIACHEESLKNGKAISEEEILENLKLAKELNCNYMRLAHYPHTEKTAMLADELGIMLWEEIPVYWAIDFENPVTIADAQNQLKELIKRDRNRASIIIWSVGNENADIDARLIFMKDLVDISRKLDPTRLVSAACLVDNCKINDRLAEYLDIIGINEYYGWYCPDFSKLPLLFENSKPDKPVVITEFGGGAVANYRGTVDDMFTEDHQEAIYKKQVEVLGQISYIKGISPWILYDFRCPRRKNKFQKGYNLKGLLSKDKKHKKLAFYVMQEFYDSFK